MLFRSNHSGMETKVLDKGGYEQIELRENHSGMETSSYLFLIEINPFVA